MAAGEADRVAREVLAHSAAGAGAHAVLSLPRGAPAADVRVRYKQARCLKGQPDDREWLRDTTDAR